MRGRRRSSRRRSRASTSAVEGDQAEDLERFVRAYYAHVAPDDLSDRSDVDLYGAALAHWNLARVRQPGEPKVHVYTPNVEEHGWESPHTVVETVVDDMPFLVDSVSMEVTRNGSAIHLVIRPIMRVRRDEEGRLLEVGAEDGQPESLIHVEIDRQAGPEELERLRAGICRVLGDVRAAVEDWPAMRERVRDVVAELDERPRSTRTSSPRRATCSSGCDDGHFTFLGYREYDMLAEDGEDVLRAVAGSGLGILRAERRAADLGQLRAAAARGAAARAREEPAQPDEGELARDRAPALVPRLRRRQALRRGRRGRRRAALPRALHAHRLQREPLGDPGAAAQGAARGRAVGPPARAATTTRRSSRSSRRIRATSCSRSRRTSSSRPRSGILHLGERRRVRLFVRRDAFGRFFSCLVYLPRERFNTENRQRIQEILQRGVRRDERRLHDARLRVGAGAPPLRRLHRARARSRSTTSPRSRRASPRRRAPGRTTSATRSRSSSARSAPARSSSATARRSPAPTARTSPPARRCSTSSGSSGSTPTATSG